MAAAANLRSYYTDHCTTDVPNVYELAATPRGELLWNGTRTEWTTVRAWLDDLLKKYPAGALYVRVAEKMPHRGEIIAVLTKGGLSLHHCKYPGPVY